MARPAIFVMNADGTDRRMLLGGRDTHEWAPAWSPDGERIAYLAERGEDARQLQHLQPLQGRLPMRTHSPSSTAAAPARQPSTTAASSPLPER